MKKTFSLLLLLLSLHAFSAGYLKVLYIADHRTNCEDNSGKCLLARNSPDEDWFVLKYPIEGFTYEVGYEYSLLVNVEKIDLTNTISDKHLIQTKYTLSEIKSKTKTGSVNSIVKINASLPDSSKWMLYKLSMKDGTKTFSVQKAYLQFDIKNNTVSGNTECNSLNAGFSTDSTAFKFDNVVTTKMACGKHSIEPTFLNMMNSVTTYKVTPKVLYLMKGKTLLALFTRKK